eukprot:2806012-Pleurochrysis_carterae.AAC.1
MLVGRRRRRANQTDEGQVVAKEQVAQSVVRLTAAVEGVDNSPLLLAMRARLRERVIRGYTMLIRCRGALILVA